MKTASDINTLLAVLMGSKKPPVYRTLVSDLYPVKAIEQCYTSLYTGFSSSDNTLNTAGEVLGTSVTFNILLEELIFENIGSEVVSVTISNNILLEETTFYNTASELVTTSVTNNITTNTAITHPADETLYTTVTNNISLESI